MRRFIYILGVFTLTIVVAAAIGLGVLFYRGHALDTESKAFVDSAVSAIATNWSEEQLLERATPELRETMSPGELGALFAAFSRLGRLVRYEGATGGATMSYHGRFRQHRIGVLRGEGPLRKRHRHLPDPAGKAGRALDDQRLPR